MLTPKESARVKAKINAGATVWGCYTRGKGLIYTKMPIRLDDAGEILYRVASHAGTRQSKYSDLLGVWYKCYETLNQLTRLRQAEYLQNYKNRKRNAKS